MNQKSELYFGGVPSDPDIAKIREEWPDSSLRAGQTIGYEEVATIIRQDPRSTRFQYVTRRWRRLVRDNAGKIIEARGGEFVVLDESGKLAHSVKRVRRGAKQLRIGMRVSALVDRKKLSGEERDQLDHTQRKTGAMLAAGQMKTPQELPQLTD